MNDWKSIFLMYDEDIDTDDELELFSENDSEDEKTSVKYIMEFVEEVNVIEKDIEDIDDKCNKIQCTPLYDAFNAVMKLIYDVLKCFKFKTN